MKKEILALSLLVVLGQEAYAADPAKQRGKSIEDILRGDDKGRKIVPQNKKDLGEEKPTIAVLGNTKRPITHEQLRKIQNEQAQKLRKEMKSREKANGVEKQEKVEKKEKVEKQERPEGKVEVYTFSAPQRKTH